MTKEEFDLRTRQASVGIAGPVISMWQIEFAARPDQFVGMFLSEILTQQIQLRIMFLEALEMNGFFESSEPDPDNPAGDGPTSLIN